MESKSVVFTSEISIQIDDDLSKAIASDKVYEVSVMGVPVTMTIKDRLNPLLMSYLVNANMWEVTNEKGWYYIQLLVGEFGAVFSASMLSQLERIFKK
jgi:hypothetical protein